MGRERLLAIGLVLAAQCGLFPSLEGLTGGDSGGGDSGSEAAIDASDAGFCQSLSPQPTFCEDFDEHAIDAAWTISSDPATSATRDTAQFQSAPYACLLTTQTVATSALAYVDRAFNVPIGTSRFAFDIYIDQIDSTMSDDVELAFIDLGSYTLFIKHRPDSSDTYLLEGFPTDAGMNYHPIDFATPLARGQWTRVEIDTVASASGGIGTFEALMAPVGTPLAVMVDAQAPEATAAGNPTIALRIVFYSGGGGPARVYFDNVTFDMAP
jgi:hypothetical protein